MDESGIWRWRTTLRYAAKHIPASADEPSVRGSAAHTEPFPPPQGVNVPEEARVNVTPIKGCQEIQIGHFDKRAVDVQTCLIYQFPALESRWCEIEKLK